MKNKHLPQLFSQALNEKQLELFDEFLHPGAQSTTTAGGGGLSELHLESASVATSTVFLEESPLLLFVFALLLFLPADILTNHFLVNPYCADAIAARP